MIPSFIIWMLVGFVAVQFVRAWFDVIDEWAMSTPSLDDRYYLCELDKSTEHWVITRELK